MYLAEGEGIETLQDLYTLLGDDWVWSSTIPNWHPAPPEVWEDLREGWADLAKDETVDAWLALEGDRTVGTIASWKEDEGPAKILIGPKTFTFSVAATRPESRGRGIATALTWTCLAASRFWPRFGFEEVAYRLTRHINPMIAWTRENSPST